MDFFDDDPDRDAKIKDKHKKPQKITDLLPNITRDLAQILTKSRELIADVRKFRV